MVFLPSCPVCTGRRRFCIHRSYPLPHSRDLERRVQEQLKREVSGPSSSIFVGHYGYPEVFLGPMTAMGPAIQDSPQDWFGKGYAEIIEMRSLLIRSKSQENIFSRSRYVEQNQELVLASRPPETEVTFRRTPLFRLALSDHLQPMGPSAAVEAFRITENVRVPQRIERIVADELPAHESGFEIYSRTNLYRAAAILSGGLLGRGERKKMVPTRWSITATDDLVGRQLMERVRGFREAGDYSVFHASYLDNHFTILIMPGAWEFENFEVWAPGSTWAFPTRSRIIGEYEPFGGRSDYAESQAGGYYATRISVLEHLCWTRRQGRVVVFREVGEGYAIPLGVWLVRETVKHAFDRPGERFSTLAGALEAVRQRLRIPLADYQKRSVILRQRRLVEF